MKHPLFEITFGHGEGGADLTTYGDSAIQLIETALYGVVILEQVENFGKLDRLSGIVPLRRFLQKVMAVTDPYNENRIHYVAARVFDMSAKALLAELILVLAGLGTVPLISGACDSGDDILAE